MASGPRKVKIDAKDLPPLIKLADNSYGYLTRHRVIAEDRNRFSPWSSVSGVSAFDFDNVAPTVSGDITSVGNSFLIVWDDAAAQPRYDVFVRWDSGAWGYHGTSPIHTYSIVNNVAATTSIEVAIQIDSINKERADVLTICQVSATIGA